MTFAVAPQAFQRQVQERLSRLEPLNEQYRRLARENRTDGAGELRLRVDRGNRRWDDLRRRAAAVLRRLKVTSLAAAIALIMGGGGNVLRG